MEVRLQVQSSKLKVRSAAPNTKGHVAVASCASVCCGMLAGSTGLEPAASAVTGQRSSQLNYDPKLKDCLAHFLRWWAVQGSNL